MPTLIGAVSIVLARLSGWVDRTGVPQVAVVLALGASFGPIGLGLLDASTRSLAALVLGPGTMRATACIVGAAAYPLGRSWPLTAILGAAIASTDAILLRAC